MHNDNQFCVKLIHCGNINLVNPADREQKNIFLTPMGLFALGACLKHSGVDVEIIHSDLESAQDLESILGFRKIDAVGFDCHWINQANTVLDTAARVKEINPRVFIFLGGFSASLFAREIVSGYSQVDAVIRGDAEVPIVELCEALQGKYPLDNVQNLVWKDKDRGLLVNDFTYTARAEDIEALDFAAVDLMRNFEAYRAGSNFWTSISPISESPLFLLEVGRGCQYACTFCGGNCVAQHRINNRKTTVIRSVDSVLATIKKAVSYGFETFFACLEFQDSDQWYLELFRRIKEEELDINLAYGCWGLPSFALIDAISKCSRNVIIEISPETSSIHLRKKNKDLRLFYSNEQLEETLAYAERKENIKIQLYFGYYLAGDTEQTIMETLRYILNLVLKYPHLLEIEYSNFSTDPGSLFFFNPHKYQLDMKVRTFHDYQEYLIENYVVQQGQPYDMTLHRPKGISSQQEAELLGKILWLSDLFHYYRKSVSYLLQKTRSPDVILSFLEKTSPSIPPGPAATLPDELKPSLLTYCSEHNLLDNRLIKLIAFESENNRVLSRLSYFNPRFYLDPEIDLQGSSIFESMAQYIHSRISTAAEDEHLDIEFNL